MEIGLIISYEILRGIGRMIVDAPLAFASPILLIGLTGVTGKILGIK